MRRFILVAVVVAGLAAGAILFAPGMFADSRQAPAESNAAVVSSAWRDVGASAPSQRLSAAQLRNAAPANAVAATYRDAGASAPLLAAPAMGYIRADTSSAANAALGQYGRGDAGNTLVREARSALSAGTAPALSSHACRLPNGRTTVANC